MRSQTLIDFFKPLLDLPAVMEGEAPQVFVIEQDFTARQIKLFTREDFTQLQEKFGESLTIIIGRPEAPLLKIKGGKYEGDPAKDLAFIASLADDSLLPFKLTIDKTVLIAALKIDTYANVFLFFFRQRVSAFLKRELEQLDTDLFKASGATLVLVSGFEGGLNGEFLAIYNEEEYLLTRPKPGAIDKKTLTSLKEYQRIPLERVNWSGFELSNLTPLHLLCEASGKDGKAAAAILNSRLMHLLVLFSANRTLRGKDGHFHATYASSDHTAELSFADDPTVVKKPVHLAGLVRWISEEKTADRLAIFQNTAARELTSQNPVENFRTFAARVDGLKADAEWHNRVMIDGQIASHFTQVEQVQTFLATVTGAVSTALDTVTKGFTDALLAAVATVVVAIISSLIKKDIQSPVFILAVSAYAIYLSFLLIYRMGSILHSYLLLMKETRERVKGYSEHLTPQKIKPLMEPLERRKRQFWVWYILTAVLYTLIIVGLVLVSQNPGWLVV